MPRDGFDTDEDDAATPFTPPLKRYCFSAFSFSRCDYRRCHA
jgi:hypothetical protein